MAVSVTMPRLGESVTEGTVTRWLKKEGERVEADEPLLEVSTDKVDTEIPSPAAGVLSSIKVQEDETVEVGVELAVIDDGAGDAAPAAAPVLAAVPAEVPAEAPAVPPAPAPPAPVATPAPPAPVATPAPVAAPAPPAASAPVATPAPAAPAPVPVAPGPVAPGPVAQKVAAAQPPVGSGTEGAYVTPLVRKLAAEHGVELATVSGTGVGGRIRKQDILDAASQTGKEAPAAPAAPVLATSAPAPAPVPAPQPASQAAPASSAPASAAPASAVRGRTESMSRLRKVIAQRMTESLQISAQLTTVLEADVTKIARLRQQAKGDFEAREGVKLSFLPFFALATVEALKVHPVLNCSIDQAAGTITYHET